MSEPNANSQDGTNSENIKHSETEEQHDKNISDTIKNTDTLEKQKLVLTNSEKQTSEINRDLEITLTESNNKTEVDCTTGRSSTGELDNKRPKTEASSRPQSSSSKIPAENSTPKLTPVASPLSIKIESLERTIEVQEAILQRTN